MQCGVENILYVKLLYLRQILELRSFSSIPNFGLKGIEKEPYADTLLCANSKNAILRSCGAGIAAADNLMNKIDYTLFLGMLIYQYF